MSTSTQPQQNARQMKTVYTVVERGPGKSFWTKVGVGFVNNDGSLNLRLDALPTNGTLQVRDYEPREWERRDGERRDDRRPTPALNADSLL
jgi:hypothetical protein